MPHANRAKGSMLVFLYQASPHNGSAHSGPDLLATHRPCPLRDPEPKGVAHPRPRPTPRNPRLSMFVQAPPSLLLPLLAGPAPYHPPKSRPLYSVPPSALNLPRPGPSALPTVPRSGRDLGCARKRTLPAWPEKPHRK